MAKKGGLSMQKQMPKALSGKNNWKKAGRQSCWGRTAIELKRGTGRGGISLRGGLDDGEKKGQIFRGI